MKVSIDPYAGFCFGVRKAIEKAEHYLSLNEKVYSLGEIVHNEAEVERLKSLGILTINHDSLGNLKNEKVLIRAHGEPPSTYRIAKENNIELLEATCPIVLKLQEKIRKESQKANSDKQIVIAGKPTHPEVIGLVGNTGGKATVIETLDDLDNLDYKTEMFLFLQTTLNQQQLDVMISEIKTRFRKNGVPESYLSVMNKLCKHVSGKEPMLKLFAESNEVVVFVSGKNSSNGKMLYKVCKQSNPKSYFVGSAEEVKKEWLINANKVGITGATSTPRWLMEQIKETIEAI